MSAVQSKQIESLLRKYIDDTITPEELYELREFVHDAASTELFQVHLQATFADTALSDNNNDDKELVFHRIREELHCEPAGTGKTLSLKKTKLFVKYYWAAAALLAVISITYLVLTLRGKEEPQPQIVNISKDIKAPDKNNAFITLANGTILYLDSTGNGSLAQQGNIQLVKLANGQIVYKTTDGEILKEIQYNTLNNPRGSQVINMQLSDGTHVWLNAGSSVTYPVAFAGRERKVSITGEAYFEVAHDNTKPFYVNKGTMEVEVLGTHFNVNAYDDEENVRVTLLEGSVKVMSNSNPESASGVQQAKILKPGEQARVNLKPVRTAGGAEMINLELADLDEVMAWKNGKFDFGEGVDIETLMRQIARWYDVEVVYKEKPGKLFRGRIPREMSAANVFRALEETGGVYFSIDGKKVTVMK